MCVCAFVGVHVICVLACMHACNMWVLCVICMHVIGGCMLCVCIHVLTHLGKGKCSLSVPSTVEPRYKEVGYNKTLL